MRFECPRCDEALSFEKGDLPRGGRRLVCPSCGKALVVVPRVAWGAAGQPVSGHGEADRMWASRGGPSGLTGTPGPAGALEPPGGSTQVPPAADTPPTDEQDLPGRASPSSWVLAAVGLLLVLIGLGLALGAVFRDGPEPEVAVER